MQKQLSSPPRAAKSATRHVLVPPPIPGVIEVVELPDRQQRHLDARPAGLLCAARDAGV